MIIIFIDSYLNDDKCISYKYLLTHEIGFAIIYLHGGSSEGVLQNLGNISVGHLVGSKEGIQRIIEKIPP